MIPKSDRQRARSRSKSRKNRDRYIYDDDDSQQYTISSRVAEDGDRYDLSMEGLVIKTCEAMMCYGAMPGDESSQISNSSDFLETRTVMKREIKEMKREIKEMERKIKSSPKVNNKMIDPASVTDVESGALAQTKSRSGLQTRSNGLQIDMRRSEPQNTSKPMALRKSNLNQIDARDEQEMRRREQYLTELGNKPGYEQRQCDVISPLLGCLDADFVGTCIQWNDLGRRPDNSDNVSEITTPYVAKVWTDADFNTMDVVEMPPELRSSHKSQPRYGNQFSAAPSKLTRRMPFGDAIIATAARKRLQMIKSKSPLRSSITHGSKTPSSISPYAASPGEVYHLKTLSRKVKAKKLKNDDGIVLFEV